MNTFFKTIPRLAWIFSGHNPFRCLIIMIRLWYVLIAADMLSWHPNQRIRCTYKGVDFMFGFTSKADIAVMKEVFIWEEYKWELGYEPTTILDLGAHVGDTALYYHARYPEAQIFAVEPDPDLFARLQANVANIPEIKPLQAAIGKENGQLEFHRSQKSSLGGTLMSRQAAGESITVKALTLDALYQELGVTSVDLCKFDIEGSEQFLFVNQPARAYARAYIGELHYDLMDIDEATFMHAFAGCAVTAEPLRRKQRFALHATVDTTTR